MVLFFLGFSLRLVVFVVAHNEIDEIIYIELVKQLDSGNGYTLQGTPLLELDIIDRNGYDKPLFFHPPGGIALFWLFYNVIGIWGFPLAQLFSYVLFFCSMILLARLFGLASSSIGLLLVAGLSAFSPIMAHVTIYYWLDGPLLGFSTLASAVFIWAVKRESALLAIISGLLLGYASLIKLTAFLIFPGITALAWLLCTDKKKFLRFVPYLIVPAILVQTPWEVYQWIKVGTPFPGWAGKPCDSLIESNNYVKYLTVIRSHWIYLSLLPRIMCTFIPSIFLYIFLWKNKSLRRQGACLFMWIFVVIIFHVILAYLGYSKVVRYIILITPPSILLFSILTTETIRRIELGIKSTFKKSFTAVILLFSGLSFFAEILTGIVASFNYYLCLIDPIFGGF